MSSYEHLPSTLPEIDLSKLEGNLTELSDALELVRGTLQVASWATAALDELHCIAFGALLTNLDDRLGECLALVEADRRIFLEYFLARRAA